jgi:hypothetical protein
MAMSGLNVMRKWGRIVLMDFSAAIKRAHSRGSAGGACPYMSPRFSPARCRGAADIYAGVVLYRLVSGKFPVEGRTAASWRRTTGGPG